MVTLATALATFALSTCQPSRVKKVTLARRKLQMAFDDQNKGNPSSMNKGPNQGQPDRNNPSTPIPGQGHIEGKANDLDNEQELDEQAKATGQMSNQTETNPMVGTS